MQNDDLLQPVEGGILIDLKPVLKVYRAGENLSNQSQILTIKNPNAIWLDLVCNANPDIRWFFAILQYWNLQQIP